MCVNTSTSHFQDSLFDQTDCTKRDKAFKSTKFLLTLMILRAPLRDEFKSVFPNHKADLEDTMVAALILFMQIVYKLHETPTSEWDHSSLVSRITLAISAGIAIKFCMDDQPFSTSFFLSLAVRPGELHMGGRTLLNYVCEFEKDVLRQISVYRCSLNHKCWAAAFLQQLQDQKELSVFTAKRIYEIVVFVCFNICEFLPVYDESEETIAESIVVVSIQCTQHGHGAGSVPITKSKILCPLLSYDLATRMAHALADKPTDETQTLFGGPFMNTAQWQNRATTPLALRRVAFDMERKKRLCAAANR